MYGRIRRWGGCTWLRSLIVVLFAGTSVAQADSTSYEGMDYADGGLGFEVGGTGWGGAWASDGYYAADVHTDHTLTYQDSNGEDLPVAGKGAAVTRTSREIHRLFNQTHSGGDNVVWLSFLFQPTLNTFSGYVADENEFSIEFRDAATGVVRFQIEKNENIDNFLVTSQGASQNTGTPATTDDVHFFVVRCDFGSGSNDGSIHVFHNPDLGSAAPALGTAWASLTGLTVADMAFNEIRFTAAPGNLPSFDTQFRFDEIRLGAEYGDVAPSASAPGGGVVLTPGSGFTAPTPQPPAVGTGEWADADAIARWDVVPHQRFDGLFNVGVVAFHVGGIDRVEFSVDGGTWEAVDQPTVNPVTGVEEYWATLDAGDFFVDGEVEVRAIAYPNVGVPRVLQGAISGAASTGLHSLTLYANAGGTLDPQTLYVSPNGSDSNAGTQQAPLLTLQHAMESISDGGRIVLLEPARYTFGTPSKHIGPGLSNLYWVTVEADDPADRDATIIEQPDGTVIRPGIGKMRWHNVSFDNATFSQYYGGTSWFDEARWFDAEGWTAGDRTSPIRGTYYATDSIAEDKLYGFTNATLARNVTVQKISGDALQNSKFVLNATLHNIDGTVLSHHTDAYQMWDEAENVIVYGIDATDLTAVQSIFLEPTWRSGETDPLLTLSNAAFVDLVFDNDLVPKDGEPNWGGPPYSQIFPHLEHVLFHKIELPNQRLMLRGQGPHPFSAEDVLFDDMVVHWATWDTYFSPSADPITGVTFTDGTTP